MKIGIFLPNATFDLPGSPEVGGIETFAFTVGEALQKLGHEVVLFGGKPKFPRQHLSTTLDLELFDYWETKSIPDIGTRFQRLIQRIHFGYKSRKKWRDHRFDVALLSKPFDWPVAYFWKRHQPSLKVVMGFHGTDFFAGDLNFYSAIDRAFAVSSSVANLAKDHVGKRPVLIPNPTDTLFFTPQKFPAPLNKESHFKIVSSGRLVGWKGFASLIKALGILHRSGVQIYAKIAGEGPEEKILRQLILENRLESFVELPGRLNREELARTLSQADAYVAPSIGMEAFSISALEAASLGLPLLLSDQIGLSHFLTSTDFMSYKAREEADLIRALQDMISRKDEATWIDRMARHERMQKLFAPEVVARQILSLVT